MQIYSQQIVERAINEITMVFSSVQFNSTVTVTLCSLNPFRDKATCWKAYLTNF